MIAVKLESKKLLEYLIRRNFLSKSYGDESTDSCEHNISMDSFLVLRSTSV